MPSFHRTTIPFKGGSRGVSKLSRNWSDHLWLVFACTSLIMSMLPYSYTIMRWKPVIKVSRSALAFPIWGFLHRTNWTRLAIDDSLKSIKSGLFITGPTYTYRYKGYSAIEDVVCGPFQSTHYKHFTLKL